MRRPLVGEPLPLDLVNTHWVDGSVPQDLLADVDGVRSWLVERDLLPDLPVPGLPEALREARAALRQPLLQPDQAVSYDALNALLAHGHLRWRLAPEGAQGVVEVYEERWRIPWTAAHELVDLLREQPTRIRRCGGDGCVLWFLDTTRSNTRRWCTMEGCGNRSKASRYRSRHATP